jgi:hypothetical protein
MEELLHYLKSHTGVAVETIFTVLTSLFVFGMGILSNWVINLIKQYRQRKNYRKTINLLLDNLSDICRKQYLNTSKRLESYSILNNKFIGIQLHVYTPMYFLNKMDYSVFISNYVRGCRKNLKAKACVKVFKIIGYTDTLEQETVEASKFFFDSLKPHQETYVKNILEIESIGRELPAIEFVDYDFKKECQEVFDQWGLQKHDHSFTHTFTFLISPLKRLLDRFTMEPNAARLLQLTDECHQAYSDLSHTDKAILEQMKRFAWENRRVYKELIIALKVFGYKPFYHARPKYRKYGIFRRSPPRRPE